MLTRGFRTLSLALLRGYRHFFSPLLGSHCRFYPSCSCYMTSCIERYAPPKALAKGIWRLLRCNPLSAGGMDPVE